MNLVPGAPAWLLAILFAAMAAAAIEDFIRLRISNITCAAVFVAALVAMGMEGFTLDLWRNALVFAVLLTLGTLMFAAGKIGGGGVKFFAAVGLWGNLSAGVWLASTSLLAGGVLALSYIVVRPLRGGRARDSARGGPGRSGRVGLFPNRRLHRFLMCGGGPPRWRRGRGGVGGPRPGVEDGVGGIGRGPPAKGPASEQFGQCAAGKSDQAGQRDAREQCGPCRADLGVGGAQLIFGFEYIRAAQEHVGIEPRGKLGDGRRRLVD